MYTGGSRNSLTSLTCKICWPARHWWSPFLPKTVDSCRSAPWPGGPPLIWPWMPAWWHHCLWCTMLQGKRKDRCSDMEEWKMSWWIKKELINYKCSSVSESPVAVFFLKLVSGIKEVCVCSCMCLSACAKRKQNLRSVPGQTNYIWTVNSLVNSFKAASPWSGSKHNEKNTKPWTPAQQMHPHIHIIKHLYFERAGDGQLFRWTSLWI